MKIVKCAKIIIALIVTLTMSVAPVYSLPTDWEIQEGTADITIDDTTMTINANDPATIINFSSFDIGQHEYVFVNLPSAESRILNRVNGGSGSELLGSLDCNGLFVLVNTSGIHVGPNANITAGSLILSTRDITNTDFMNGDYVFAKLSDEQLDKLLLNEGNITVYDGGFGVLIAGAVENRGIIIAPAGRIALAGGDAIRLEMSADGLISVAIDEKTASTILDLNGAPITDQIKNTGTLQAQDGQVILSAESVQDIFEKAINLEGVVRSNRIEVADGGIVKMVADKDITINADIETHETEIVSGGEIGLVSSIKSESLTLDGESVTIVRQPVDNVDIDYTTKTVTSEAEPYYFYGDTIIYNLTSTVPWTQIYFEEGTTCTLRGNVTVGVQDDTHASVFMRSQTQGETWYMNVETDDYTFRKVAVQDAVNLGETDLHASPSINWGGNLGWIFNTATWAAVAAGNWSVGDNWDGGIVPGGGGDTSEAVVFAGATSTEDCTIDSLGDWSGGTLTIDANYSGTITLAASEITTGAFAISGGVFAIGDNTLDANGSVTINAGGTLTSGAGTIETTGNWANSGTFTAGTGIVFLDAASGTQTLNSGGTGSSKTFYNLQHDSAGQVNLVTNDLDVANDFTVNSGAGTFSANALDVYVGGDLLVTSPFNAGTGTIYLDGSGDQRSFAGTYYNLSHTGSSTVDYAGGAVTGDFSNTGGTFVLEASETLRVDGNFTNSSTFTADASSTVWFWGTGTQLVDGGGSGAAFSIGNLTHDKAGTVQLTGTLDIDGNFSSTAGTFDANGQTMYVAGNWTNTATFTAGSGTVIFDGTASKNLRSGDDSFYAVEINKTGTTDASDNVTLTNDNLTITNSLTITDGELVQNALNVTTGDVTIAAAGKWTNENDGNLTLSGDVTNNGIISFKGATDDGITIASSDGATQRNWQGSGTFILREAEVSYQKCTGGTPTFIGVGRGTDLGNNSNWTIGTTEVTITGSLYDAISGSKVTDAYTIELVIHDTGTTYTDETSSGDFSFTVDVGGGDVLAFYVDEATPSGCTVTEIGWDNLSGIDIYQDTVTVRCDYDELTNAGMRVVEQNALADSDKMLYGTDGSNNVDIDGTNNFYVAAGTFAPGANLTIGGNWNNDGTFDAGKEESGYQHTVTFDAASGTQTLDSGGTAAHQDFYNLSHTGAGTLKLVTNNIDIGGNFVNSAGTFDGNGLDMYAFSNSWSNTATFDGPLGTLYLDRTSNQNVTSGSTAANPICQDLDISNAGEVELQADLYVAGNLTIGSGATMDTNGNDVTVAGNFTNNGTYKVRGTETTTEPTNNVGSTVDFYGTQNINIYDWTYWNLTLGGSGAAIEVSPPAGVSLVVSGDFDTSNVKFTPGSQTVSIAGYWDIGGSFTPGTSTIVFNGSSGQQVIYGSNTWYNLSLAPTGDHEVQFVAGTTQTITNNLNIAASKSGKPTLSSTVPGSQWYINPQGGINVSDEFIYVNDSVNQGSTIIEINGLTFNCIGWKALKETYEPNPISEIEFETEAEKKAESLQLLNLGILDSGLPFVAPDLIYAKCTTCVIVINGKVAVYQVDELGLVMLETEKVLDAGQSATQSGMIVASHEESIPRLRSGQESQESLT